MCCTYQHHYLKFRSDRAAFERLTFQTELQATWEEFNNHIIWDGSRCVSGARVLHFGGHADEEHGLYWCSHAGQYTKCEPIDLAMYL